MRLKQFGLAPWLAIANTAGTSWAVARSTRFEHTIVASGAEREALCHLPVAALRLSPGARSLMRRLGLRRIADVIDQPRAPFAARFEDEFLQRLDQALGRSPEPLTPVSAPPVYRAQTTFVEPIMSQEHVQIAATRLLEQLCVELNDAEAGARVLRLLLFAVDGEVQSLQLGLATASRDPRHMAALIGLRLDRLQLDSGFGFEAAALHVVVAQPLPARQSALAMDEEHVAPDGLPCLVDRLQQRLGAGAVYQLQPVESHIPERAERAVPVNLVKAKEQVASPDAAENVPSAPRPLLLLPRPEAAEVTALIPDGPPRRFRWRGVLHQVTAAEGPERMTPEWWRRTDAAERDYFRVQDSEGRRFWLYRDGLYGQGIETRWFVHGLFA
jgi:protein ImuB